MNLISTSGRVPAKGRIESKGRVQAKGRVPAMGRMPMTLQSLDRESIIVRAKDELKKLLSDRHIISEFTLEGLKYDNHKWFVTLGFIEDKKVESTSSPLASLLNLTPTKVYKTIILDEAGNFFSLQLDVE